MVLRYPVIETFMYAEKKNVCWDSTFYAVVANFIGYYIDSKKNYGQEC